MLSREKSLIVRPFSGGIFIWFCCSMSLCIFLIRCFLFFYWVFSLFIGLYFLSIYSSSQLAGNASTFMRVSFQMPTSSWLSGL